MSALWTMDGYGPYVWTCYGAFVLMLLWDLLMPWLRKRHVLSDIRQRVRRDAAKKQAARAHADPTPATRTEAGQP